MYTNEMELESMFAAHALTGLLSHHYFTNQDQLGHLTKMSWAIAGAMVKSRPDSKPLGTVTIMRNDEYPAV